MIQEAILELLSQGVDAAKKGQPIKARDLLLKVVDVDPENEKAWLWLSSVVENDDDRRICLENALALNPENVYARRGLEKLGQESRLDTPLVTYHQEPIFLEGQDKPSEIYLSRSSPVVEPVGTPSQIRTDDIWELDIRLCAYCAEQIEAKTTKCPACGRKLMVESYRYSKASVDLSIYWVLLIGIVQLYLVQILIRYLIAGDLGPTVWQGLVIAVLVVIIVGVMFRRFLAYVASIVSLLLIATAMMFDWYLSVGPEEILVANIKANFIKAIAANPFLTLGSPLLSFIRPLHFGAVVLALLYGIFKVAPDFERVSVQLAAAVQRGLSAPVEFFHAGREFAARGMWASAVLHWRRAAALEPTRIAHLRHLGQAYGQVGQYERSLDVLESARQIADEPEIKREVEELIAKYRAKSQSNNEGKGEQANPS